MRSGLWYHAVGAEIHPPMLLIPGAFQCARDWPDTFVNTLADEGFRVILIDHRDSGRNMWTGGIYDLEDMAADIEHFMIIHRLRNVHVVGASMGGAIAQLVALHAASSLQSLTLLSTTSGRGVWDSCLPPPSEKVMNILRVAADLEAQGLVERALIHRYTHLAGQESAPFTEARRARRVIRHGYNPFAMHGEAFRRTAVRTGRLSLILKPTLIVHGSDDELFHPSHAHLLHDCIPNASLDIIDRMRHHLSETNGADVARRISLHASLAQRTSYAS